MKGNRLSILLILVISSLLIFSNMDADSPDTMGMHKYPTQANEGGETEDSPDDQLDHPGVIASLKASFIYPEGNFLRFLSGFSLSPLLILFSTSILRC